jgi:hypothetical protein
MSGRLPPEDEIARLRVENEDQGAVLTDPGCRPDGSSPRGVSPPIGASIPRAKSKPSPELVMAEYLSAYRRANGKKPNFRLVYIGGWVIFKSLHSSMELDKKRLKTLTDMTQRLFDMALAPGIETGTATPDRFSEEEGGGA